MSLCEHNACLLGQEAVGGVWEVGLAQSGRGYIIKGIRLYPAGEF